jgi:hypothetical protein
VTCAALPGVCCGTLELLADVSLYSSSPTIAQAVEALDPEAEKGDNPGSQPPTGGFNISETRDRFPTPFPQIIHPMLVLHPPQMDLRWSLSLYLCRKQSRQPW